MTTSGDNIPNGFCRTANPPCAMPTRHASWMSLHLCSAHRMSRPNGNTSEIRSTPRLSSRSSDFVSSLSSHAVCFWCLRTDLYVCASVHTPFATPNPLALKIISHFFRRLQRLSTRHRMQRLIKFRHQANAEFMHSPLHFGGRSEKVESTTYT